MGALGGHIPHLYEDRDITFRKIKEIIKRVGTGRINDAYEKCDGINLFVTWDFDSDQLRIARNKGHIKLGGLNEEAIRLKFSEPLATCFESVHKALTAAFGSLDHQTKASIFGATGGVWFSTEVIDPSVSNTLHYDNRNIIFHKHGPVLFSFDGEPLATNLDRNVELMSANVHRLNDGLQGGDWCIHGPTALTVMPVDESFITKAHKTLDGLTRRASVQPFATVRQYIHKRLVDEFDRYPLVHSTIKDALARNLAGMPNAPTLKQVQKGLDRGVQAQIRNMIEDGKHTMEKVLQPIEQVVHEFGTQVMCNMKSSFIEDGDTEIARLRTEVNRCVNTILNGDDEKGKHLVKMQLAKMGSVDAINTTMEGIVFREGDRTYKLTGTFAPANRICAYVKYKIDPQPKKHQAPSLAQFIFAG